ncbi:MAG: Bax inhibitor-1/YccA family protein [Candidatus Omnitrophica bacterium]|nr:Bax inhibitor-1/YccA family protein [Candidatus Omnitrophota bacterium]
MNQNEYVDIGLSREAVSERSFLSQVYFWMAMGLALTGVVAGWMAINPSLVVGLMRNTGFFVILALLQIGLVFWLSSQVMNLSLTTATVGFSIYATLNGVLFSSIFLVYTSASIASTFLITAGMFGAISLYGFATKRDLTSIGSYAFMGLIGVIIASVLNWFFKSPAFYWIITYIGIAVFVGLTAYDTQKLKLIHQQGFSSGELMKKVALLGALTLYLDFINLFLLLLRVMGRRR